MRRGLAAVVVLMLAAVALTGCGLAIPGATTSVTGAGATLNGNVYSNLTGNTDYWWRYGTGTTYGSETPHRTVAINNTQPHPASEAVTGLSASTTYHFQMCARDGMTPPATVCSADGTFTTLAPVGERALAIAGQYRGTPFVYGGASPATGFDDSGLVQYSFGQVGVTLPRVAYQQITAGTAVALANLSRGDLVFFSTDMSGVANHVGIFEGSGTFLHAPHTGDVIKSASINDPFYLHTFLGGRRISG